MSECLVGDFVKQVNALNQVLGNGFEPGEGYRLRQNALEAYETVLATGDLKTSVVAIIEDLSAFQIDLDRVVREPLGLNVLVARETGNFVVDLFDKDVELELAE